MSTQTLLKCFWSVKPKLDPLYLIPDGWEVERQRDLEFSHILKPRPFTGEAEFGNQSADDPDDL